MIPGDPVSRLSLSRPHGEYGVLRRCSNVRRWMESSPARKMTAVQIDQYAFAPPCQTYDKTKRPKIQMKLERLQRYQKASKAFESCDSSRSQDKNKMHLLEEMMMRERMTSREHLSMKLFRLVVRFAL